MGDVYRARDSRLNRVVAIKVLSDQAAGDPDRRERFEREAAAIKIATMAHYVRAVVAALWVVGLVSIAAQTRPTLSNAAP